MCSLRHFDILGNAQHTYKAVRFQTQYFSYRIRSSEVLGKEFQGTDIKVAIFKYQTQNKEIWKSLPLEKNIRGCLYWIVQSM